MTLLWLTREAVDAIHPEQLSIHGGLPGLKDENALEAALARPENKAAYGNPDLFELAAAYLFGIVTAYPYSDGNKRTGFLAAFAFLYSNRWHLQAPEAEAYELVMGVAAGDIIEEGITRWLTDRSVALEGGLP